MLKGKSGKIISAALTFSLTLSLLSTSLFSAQAETAVNQSTSVGRSDAAESISLSKREIKWKEGEIIRIMPLGDSITENDNCYWRLMLWNKLAEAGYDSSKIDFVGDRWGDRDMTT